MELRRGIGACDQDGGPRSMWHLMEDGENEVEVIRMMGGAERCREIRGE